MTLAPLGAGCACVSAHSPAAYVPTVHHVLPKSWGGASTSPNLVTICPNTHEAVHRLIDEHVRYGGVPPWDVRRHFSEYQRNLAARAWAQRPTVPTFTTEKGRHDLTPEA